MLTVDIYEMVGLWVTFFLIYDLLYFSNFIFYNVYNSLLIKQKKIIQNKLKQLKSKLLLSFQFKRGSLPSSSSSISSSSEHMLRMLTSISVTI